MAEIGELSTDQTATFLKLFITFPCAFKNYKKKSDKNNWRIWQGSIEFELEIQTASYLLPAP